MQAMGKKWKSQNGKMGAGVANKVGDPVLIR